MDPHRLSKIFKALANPNRLLLFHEIRRGQSEITPKGCFLNPIKERLKIGAPTISHHLKELVNAGLIITQRDGKFVQCRVNQTVVDEVESFIRLPEPA